MFVCHGKGKNLFLLSLQCLRSLVRHSLELASWDRMTSVSFPAIGSGNLHFPQSTVASVMFDEVANFSARNRGCSVKTVYFVVYQKDQTTIDVSNVLIRANRPSLVSPLIN